MDCYTVRRVTQGGVRSTTFTMTYVSRNVEVNICIDGGGTLPKMGKAVFLGMHGYSQKMLLPSANISLIAAKGILHRPLSRYGHV